jgi:oligopeptide/dipeptide ABC transporter ATP-binding protein
VNLLTIEGLKVYYHTSRGVVKAVDGVNLSIRVGETLGLVGESGSGKTTLAYSIVRLLPPGARIVDGVISFRPRGMDQVVDLVKLPESRMREIRGRRIGMIFQDPMTFLNPVMKVGDQIAEGIIWHEKCSRDEAKERAIKLLEEVKVPDPSTVASYYPHQLSGGMRQRVMIAISISCNPQLLIADEPTTALDVTVQAQILRLIKELQTKFGMSLLLITHDLAVAANVCERVAVMYAGKIMEEGNIHDIYRNPMHPYTAAMLRVTPRLAGIGGSISAIEGELPDLTNPPSGCRFHPRCPFVMERCSREEPPPGSMTSGRRAACWMAL